MKIAIIGAGISGVTCSVFLNKEHDITVFEAENWPGGHTHTVDVEENGKTLPLDTGFIVFNDWTYPNFIKLLEMHKVKFQPTSMSFSVRDEATGLEYSGTTLNTLFAQRRNILRPSFYRMIKDILRFNKDASTFPETGDAAKTMRDYLHENNFSKAFIHQYILPMGAAIWSSREESVLDFPALFFTRFFRNHGMLSVNERPQWYVIKNGSRNYVKAFIEPFKNNIRLNTPVQSVRRTENGVEILTKSGAKEIFDAVILAAHADQSLRMLADPSEEEQRVLSSFGYQSNQVALHTDKIMLPKKKLAHACWNYLIPKKKQTKPSVTYYMNMLQNLDCEKNYLVSLNSDERIKSNSILNTFTYAHPVFSRESEHNTKLRSSINGVRNTWYCGAYWRYGFHEDGVVSSLAVLKDFGIRFGGES